MTKELQRKLADLRRKMREACSPLPPDQKEERLIAVRHDDDAFAAAYLPHLYRQTAPEFHQVISAALAARDNEIRFIAAPRNHAKTTRGIIHLARVVCFADVHRATTISASKDLAAELLEPLRISLAENPRIIQDFGQLIIRSSDGDFRAKGDVKVDCRGREQSLRGPKNDLIWIDDIETDQQARDKAQTDKLIDVVLEILYNRLMPASDGGGAFVGTGTILSRKAMLAQFLNINKLPEPEYPEITKFGKLYRAINTDSKGRPAALWPERLPLDALDKIKQRIKARRFNKEYMDDPRDDDSLFTYFEGFHALEFMKAAEEAVA
jgi:hypothetical protein